MIRIPDDIKEALDFEIHEEKERRAYILEADGARESAITRSRGAAAQTVLLAEADKAPIAASCQRNKEAVIAAQKAGEQPQIDNMLKCFNWMRAFPLLKSHLEAASAASTSTSASNETVRGVGKKRAGATQTKPPAKKQAKTKPPAKKQAKPK